MNSIFKSSIQGALLSNTVFNALAKKTANTDNTFWYYKRHVMFPVRNNKTFFFFEKVSQGRTKLEEISIHLYQNIDTLYSTKAVYTVTVHHNIYLFCLKVV